MLITSKSLHRANFVVAFEEGKFVAPDNPLLTALYQGQEAAGAHFIDDPVLRTKILDLPRLKIQVAVEPNRFLVEYTAGEEPRNSRLISEATRIYQQLFAQFPLTSFGFNFDFYYRFSDVIRLKDLLLNFSEPKILEKADLRDLGVQFTLEKEGGKKQETYFIKITAPLEVAVHLNTHFNQKKLPGPEDLQKIFEKCYNEIDETIQLLRL